VYKENNKAAAKKNILKLVDFGTQT